MPETVFTFYPSMLTVYATVVADLINRPVILVSSTNRFRIFHANSRTKYVLMSISRISLPSSKYLSWTGTNVVVNSARLILSCCKQHTSYLSHIVFAGSFFSFSRLFLLTITLNFGV